MKNASFMTSLILFLFLAVQLQAQHHHDSSGNQAGMEKTAMHTGEGVTDTFTVYGNCGMCKKRIEGCLKEVEGVSAVEWNAETKLLTVKYDDEVISSDDIKKKVADAGHDTDKFRARDDVYANLPGCCQYDRPKN